MNANKCFIFGVHSWGKGRQSCVSDVLPVRDLVLLVGLRQPEMHLDNPQ